MKILMKHAIYTQQVVKSCIKANNLATTLLHYYRGEQKYISFIPNDYVY